MTGASNGLPLSEANQIIDTAVSTGKLRDSSSENLKRWLNEPFYSKYQEALLELVAAEQFSRLDDLFWKVIEFGTGGRRGLMAEFGSATINDRTIAESAHGLAVYLKKIKGEAGGRAVVACDTRIRSSEFARLTATTLAANELKVFIFEAHRSTPELSFAVRHLNCDVGAMISASHNPPSDNGFKAYWSSGGQVLPPHDAGIIRCVDKAGEIPELDFDRAVSEGRIEVIGEDLDRAYIDSVLQQSLSTERDISALFSPLHGVGETSVYRVLQEAGFDGVEIYQPQQKPDGNFTNVPDQLPNPERTAVFEPLFKHAEKTGAEVILVSDPDADRLGVAVKSRDGHFVTLTGNRVGALLADYILRKRSEAGTLSSEHFVVETLVTTPLIAAVAAGHQVRVIDDLLVGFKYIAETMDQEGPEKFLFGAEESLGYLAGEHVRDKDASVAALLLMELAAELRKQGKTVLDRLDELFVRYGYFTEAQRSKQCEGAEGNEQIQRLMQTFRDSPPVELDGIPLVRVRDYASGRHEIRSLPDNVKIEDLPNPEGNLLFFETGAEECRFSVAVRPSGTEPKIKFYFFAFAPCSAPESLNALKEQTELKFTEVQDAFSAWVTTALNST
ncbi:MAG: phospho-sugar mutase [Planctomycetes bacterium]|nr:phospho-sugar mutase [Planctomycetota bacterium]